MTEKTAADNRKLIGFWDKAIDLSEQDRENERLAGPEGWRELAPSEKLFQAASSLGGRKKVLDYGCGSAWAGIIAAKAGCPDVTAVDAAPGAVRTAGFYTALYKTERAVQVSCVAPDWLGSVPAETFDGFICSNVLDVIPPETAADILRETARIVTPDASVIIGMNFYLSPEDAKARGMTLTDGNKLYVEGILRLVSRTDGEWKQVFSPYFSVERLEYFAWPGETAEKRRLFHLRRKEQKRERE